MRIKIFILLNFILINFCLIIDYFFSKKEKDFSLSKNKRNGLTSQIINEPILPLESDDRPLKDFTRTYYDSSNIRFHFEDLYNQRKIYKINYSYLPYKNTKKYDSFDKAADFIFESTGMLNITLLNYYYNNIYIDKSNFNHINLAMSFDSNYIILSKISIASILNSSSSDTFIHFHFGLNGCKYSDIKNIIELNRINKNVEFIFYKSIQAEYDFYNNAKKGFRGIGDYTRVLLPQIVNNTNRLLILDSADIISQKDLSELYFFDIGDNYFSFSLEFAAGVFDNYYLFQRNKFYPNTGVCLVNIRKFREDNLYKRAFFAAIAYNHLPCPYQDLFLMVSNYKFKYWPLNYNAPQFFQTDQEIKDKPENASSILNWLKSQENTPFRYNVDELMNAALHPVIYHLYFNKPYLNLANKEITKMWLNYSKLANVYEKIKLKYPEIISKVIGI